MIFSITIPLHAQKENSYKVSIINIIEEQGGSLKTLVKIIPSQKTTGLVAYLPKDFLGENSIIIGILDNNRFTPDIKLANETIEIKFDNLDIDAEKQFTIEIYNPNIVNQTDKGIYICKFLSSIILDHPISSLTTQVKMPPNTKVVKPPSGYSQIQVTPPGVKPELHRLEKTYSMEELEELRIPTLEIINMTSTRGRYASIKLLNMNLTIVYTIEPDSTIHSRIVIKTINTGKTTWSGNDYLKLFKGEGGYNLVDLKAHTELNRELKINSTKQDYRIQLPYDVKPGDKAVIILEYNIIGAANRSGLLGEEISYKIEFSNLTENVINLLNITVLKPDGGKTYTNMLHNYSQFSEPIIVKGETTVQPFELVIYSGAGYIIVALILAGISFTGYQLYIKSGLRELPEEARKYFDKFKGLTVEMNKLIDLEDKKISGKIREREYLKKRADINKRIGQIKKEIDTSRKMIEDMASENSYVKEVLDEIKEIEKYWSELKRIEEGFRRKRIKPDEYREKRRETITLFKTHLTRLESKL